MSKLTLAELSHETLVNHTTQLQLDYDKLSETLVQKNEELDDVEEDFEEAVEEIKGLKTEIASLKANLDRSGEDLQVQKDLLNNQVTIKNRHIDLHRESSRRANEAEEELKMVRASLEEVSGHLRDQVEETKRSDDHNATLAMNLEDANRNARKLEKENKTLRTALADHPRTMDAKGKMAELRYKTAQTLIRWGALFATATSIGYHLT